MKKLFLLSIIVILFIAPCFAQNVGIGTTTPNASAILEIKASNKGLLIPRTSTTSRTAIVNPAIGLIVYDTTTSSFWYHNGTAWTQIGTAGTGWSLTGNAGTNPSTNFIGTTDSKPLTFKVNNLRAGFIDTTSQNTGMGFKTLDSITTGINNAAFGYKALINDSSGSQNTAIGSNALRRNTTGSFNTATGFTALVSNTTGIYNVADGVNALYSNITGIGNTASGLGSLFSNTSGSTNSALGANALYSDTSGSNNTATGLQALFSNTNGSTNTESGDHALYNNQTGYSNVAIGTSALFNTTNGSNQVAIGDSALYNNGLGVVDQIDQALNNTAVGSKALYSNITGSLNTANGFGALYFNTSGDYNTANGMNALQGNIAGTDNTAIGADALEENNGSFNTAIGVTSLNNNTTGSKNTAVGSNADVSNGNLTNATAIGANAIVSTSNTIQLGNGGVTSVNTSGDVTANGYMCKPGINSATRGNVFNIDWTPGGAAQLWIDATNLGTISFTSDRRLKENIDLMKANGIERMMELKPVHFMYKKIEGTLFSGSSQEQEGFIADELQQVIPSAVNGEKDALTSKGTIQPQTINIVPVVAVLTKALQEQQQIIETQKNDIDALRAEVAQLTKMVNKLINK